MASVLGRKLSASLPVVLGMALLAVTAPAAHAADGDSLFGWQQSLSEVSVNPVATAAYRPAVTLDGDLAEWAELPGIAGPSTREQNTINPWNGPADLSYEAHFGYDEENFYLGVAVTDDVHDPMPGGSSWLADSVHFSFGAGASRSEFSVAVDGDVNDVARTIPGGSTLPPSAVRLRGRTTGTGTSYELIIPWRAVRSTAPVAGEAIPFTMIVNDSDGSGRKGHADWTPGIAGTKDVRVFGKVELLKPGQTWNTWVAGPAMVTTGNPAQYAVYVLNAGSTELRLTLDLPALGLTSAPVTVPPRQLFKKTVTATVTADLDLVATLHSATQTRTATRHVTAVKTAAQLTAMFDHIDTVVIPRVAAKLASAQARNIATDYERAYLQVIRTTSPYGREDIDHGVLYRAEYIANSLSALADQAERKLDAYLAGRERSLGPVPRYRTGENRPNGYSYVGTTTAGRNKPLIFSGYGMFEQVIADIPIFQELGNNIIGFNIYPLHIFQKPGPTDEPPAGSYYVIDETYFENRVDPALRSAEQHNIAVNVELGLQGFPEWIYQDYPDTRMQGNYGFLQADIENPRVQELYKAHVGVLMKHVKDSPAVQAVDLSNESEYQQNLGPYNLAKWHQYLPRVYRTVAAMNRVYGTAYASFADVPLPDMNNVQPNAVYFDYLTFKTERLTAFHQLLADEVHKYAPAMPVHTKLMGFGITNNDFMLKGGKDLEQFARISQQHGFDGGPNYGGGPDKFAEYVGMLDMIASMKRMPLFNSENHMIWDGETRYPADLAPWVSNWIWAGAMHGTSASLIWIWERHYTTSYLAQSILNRPDAIAQVSKASLDLGRLVNEVSAFQNADADVGLFYSMTPRLYSDVYYDTLTRAYQALSYNGQPVGYVTEDQVNGRGEKNLDDYTVLVLPEVENLSAESLRNIAKWVRRGGRVVTIGDPSTLLTRDGHNQPLSEKDRRTVLQSPRTLKVPANPSDPGLRSTFFGLLSSLHLNDTVVYDAVTNEPVRDVEWRTARYRGRTLLSLVNYTNTQRSVYVKVNGRRVTPAKDLINGTDNHAATVTLAVNGHALYVLGR